MIALFLPPGRMPSVVASNLHSDLPPGLYRLDAYGLGFWNLLLTLLVQMSDPLPDGNMGFLMAPQTPL